MKNKKDLIDHLNSIAPNEEQFHQIVLDVYDSIGSKYRKEKSYQRSKIFERLLIPDRQIRFRVSWRDDNNVLHHNQGWRIQHNNTLGVYKGGIRFHPDVTTDSFKFLSFEQSFKNALTGLPLGGAKGGSDFDPKGKSDTEIMNFCRAFMTELYSHIGPDQDVPAGDIGVGHREIGYLFGAYKSILKRHHGVLTGKDPAWGGSCIREEATGYGAVYLLNHILENEKIETDKFRYAISGAGNVALHAAEKIISLGGIVVTVSDRQGTLVKKDGFSKSDIEKLKKLKITDHGALKDFKGQSADYMNGKEPWATTDYDVAIPAATQNEIDEKEAKQIVKAKACFVCEAANMPLTTKAREILLDKKIIVLPSMAVNAGGVAISAIERTQNITGYPWTAEKVDQTLQKIMKRIVDQIYDHMPNKKNPDRFIHGAAIAAFERLAVAMMALGDTN